MDSHWYVLRSKPNKELTLWREVCARGFDCFYPQLHVRPVNPRSRKIRPYFPGYLFLQLDLEQVGTSTFHWMPFCSGLVSFDGMLATVPDHLIQAIRRHVEEINAAGSPEGKLADLKPGDAVTVQGGPFDGYEAIFDARLKGTERVRVLLTLLKARSLSVELPVTQIERVRPRQSRR